MIKKIALTAGAVALAFTLAGCGPTTDTNVEEPDSTSNPTTETAPAETDETPANTPTAATIEANYPQQWIDLNIPEVPDLTIESSNYLEEYKQTRVIAETVATPEILTGFGELLTAEGWKEDAPNAEYSKEVDGTTYVIMVDTELERTTFTIWEFTIS